MPLHKFDPLRDRQVELSQAMSDNVLGDPIVRPVAVSLPEDHDENYPLLGLATHDCRPHSPIASHTAIDRPVAEGRMGPVATVFPDCFTSLGGNRYISPATMGNGDMRSSSTTTRAPTTAADGSPPPAS